MAANHLFSEVEYSLKRFAGKCFIGSKKTQNCQILKHTPIIIFNGTPYIFLLVEEHTLLQFMIYLIFYKIVKYLHDKVCDNI